MTEYRYIGKDGKPILARDLEDQRDELQVKLDKALAALDEAITCLRNAGILYDRKIREFVDDGFRSHSRYRSNSIADLPAADRVYRIVTTYKELKGET